MNNPFKKTTENTSVDSKDIHVTWFVRVPLYIAFFGFLLTSIPHVAWLYHAFEEPSIDIVVGHVNSLIFSYMVAIGIDVTIAVLSVLMDIGAKRGNAFVVYAFVALLGALSWYANYLYVMAHDPVHQANVWNITLFRDVTTGYLTPIIISAVPIFVLAYTFILGFISGKSVSSEDLTAQADALEKTADAQARIRQARLKNRSGVAIDTVNSVKGVWHNVLHGAQTEKPAMVSGDLTETPAQQTVPEVTDVQVVEVQVAESLPNSIQDVMGGHTIDTDALALPITPLSQEWQTLPPVIVQADSPVPQSNGRIVVTTRKIRS